VAASEFRYVNATLLAWAARKFKRFSKHEIRAGQFPEKLRRHASAFPFDLDPLQIRLQFDRLQPPAPSVLARSLVGRQLEPSQSQQPPT